MNALGDPMHSASRITALLMVLALGMVVDCRATRIMPSNACPTGPLEDTRLGVRYLPCQLTSVPVLQIDTAAWRYPDMLRDAGMSGRVRVAFVVDTAGRYLPGSWRVLSSSHEMFANSTKYELARARFSSGRRGGEVVPVELTHDFIFVIPTDASARELRGVPQTVTRASASSGQSIPALEIRLNADDTMPGPPPAPRVCDSLAHQAIRMLARNFFVIPPSPAVAATAPRVVLCVQGDPAVRESVADRALAHELTRSHVRVLTMRSCPPTRDRMAALPPGMEPHYPPDSVPFVEPHRLQVVRVGLRRRGGPVVDVIEGHMLGEVEYRCVRAPTAASIFDLQCYLGSVINH